MSPFATPLLFAALTGIAWAHGPGEQPTTVCTITVNSPDEQAAFRARLPADKYRFVELIERGRPDWLAAACRQDIRCDVLVISGHYDGGHEFFSDRVEGSEFLPVDEMERVSCSDSCAGLFSQLKEVYLFGCNTLNPGAPASSSAEIERSLVRSGHAPAAAERLARGLGARHGGSSRDRMRQVFANVPTIYGFSSLAPLGPTAGALLARHFQSSGSSDVGSGRANSRLVGHFAAYPMVVAAGLTGMDPQAAHRQDICQFADDRLSTAQKLEFIHRLLDREMAEVRMFFDRIEEFAASIGEAERVSPAVAHALDAIARDRSARTRYMEFARDADLPATRARMLKLANTLGWLSASELRAELIEMFSQRLAQSSVRAADVDLACSLNESRELDQEIRHLQVPPSLAVKAGHAAALACLGSAESHARVLLALTAADDADVEIARVYLYHRPISDVNELRAVGKGIARMTDPAAQVHAIDTLARHRLSDRETLDELVRLFTITRSLAVQTAIANALIRADYRAFATSELAQTLRLHRLKSPQGEDPIDVLIRRLEASVGPPAGQVESLPNNRRNA